MLQLFEFESKQVRFVGTDEIPEWVAQDVCDCLELANVSQALDSLDEDEKAITIVDTPGGGQEMLTVFEPGLYRLIFKSRKPAANRFKRWVFHDLLPKIRKTGKYETSKPSQPDPKLIMAELSIAEELLCEMGIEPAIAKQLKVDNAVQFLPNAKQMLEAGKKLISTETVHQSVGLTPTQVGKQLEPLQSAVEVNNALEAIGFQFKQPKKKGGKDSYEWQLTDEGKEHGFVYFAAKTDKWSGDQIRWQDSVIAVIQDLLDSQAAA